MTIRLEDSALVGKLTLVLNSSIDSLIYVNINLAFFGILRLRSAQSLERLFSLKLAREEGETSLDSARDELLVSHTFLL